MSYKERNDMTPLHWAAQKGLPKIVRILVEEGADVHSRNQYRVFNIFSDNLKPLELAESVAVSENRADLDDIISCLSEKMIKVFQ